MQITLRIAINNLKRILLGISSIKDFLNGEQKKSL